MAKNWQENALLLLLFAAIALALLGPISSNTFIPDISSIQNHLNFITQAKLALMQGQFPLRVLPFQDSAWGLPVYQLGSPTSYTLAAWLNLYLMPGSPYSVYKFLLFIAFVIGGYYFYALAYRFFESKPAAILGAVAYMTAPICIIDIDHVAAFHEALGIGLLPCVLYFSFSCLSSGLKPFRGLFLCLLWYLLATIDLRTFLATSFFWGLYLSFLFFQKKAYRTSIINQALLYVFACLMAAWYLFPVIHLGPFLESGREWNLDYLMVHRPSFINLISIASNIAGASLYAEAGNFLSAIHPSIGLPILLGIALGIYALVSRSFKKEASHFDLLPLGILFVLAFFLVWTPWNFWAYLPKSLMSVQYTWSLLSQVNWLGAFIFVWSLKWLFQHSMDARHIAIGIILICLSSSTWLLNYESSFVLFDEAKHPAQIDPETGANFLIDANRFPQFALLFDRIPLNDLIKERPDALLSETNYVIASPLLQGISHPYLIVKTHLKEAKTLQMNINDRLYANQNFEAGAVNWEVPVNKTMKTIRLKGESGPEAIFLSGLIPKDHYVSADEMKKHCQQSGITHQCQISMGSYAKILELPILYYPEMLSIHLNGKIKPYFSVYYENRLITAILSEANAVNHIDIRFQGVEWANNLSECAWSIWGILWVYYFLRIYSLKRSEPLR